MQINTLMRYSNQGWDLWDVGIKLTASGVNSTSSQPPATQKIAEDPEIADSASPPSEKDSLVISEEARMIYENQKERTEKNIPIAENKSTASNEPLSQSPTTTPQAVINAYTASSVAPVVNRVA